MSSSTLEMQLMRKNVLSMFIVTALAVAVAGCGGENDSASSDATTPEVELSTEAVAGKAYVEDNCSGCHSVDGQRRSGPTFKGLSGSAVELQSGQTVTADNAYIVKSIVDPSADVVKGFPNIMGAAVNQGSVSEQEAQQIAAYIETLR
jgi:mono/diheme cytochrome c family protein